MQASQAEQRTKIMQPHRERKNGKEKAEKAEKVSPLKQYQIYK